MTNAKVSMDKVETNKPEDGGEVTVPMMTQAEFTDKMETHQAFIHAKPGELTRLMDALRAVRESKEPLAQVKNTLQEEINTCNKHINAVSEEVTHLKQKLRYHSVKQIHDNIERLEYQLRNNNFKPREEQKILDEISMLQRSIRTLREYDTKQAENKKYRAERTRLIEERNNNYSKIRALYAKEDEIKKEIAVLRGEISANRKSIDQLRQLRPKLEQEWLAQQQKLQAARNKRHEEKRRLRQEEKRKLWEEYEASKEPYEEEKNLCRLLISYLQSSLSGSTPTPSTPASTISQHSSSSTPSLTPATTPSQPPPLFPSSNPGEAFSFPSKCKDMVPPESSGAYYSKSNHEDVLPRMNKRGKAKARREQRLANRTKELPHTPDVLLKFSKLSITPPRNTDQVPAAIVSLQDQLQHFHSLALAQADTKQVSDYSEGTSKSDNTTKFSRPRSLSVVSCSQPTSAAITTTTASTFAEQKSITEVKENGQLSPIASTSSSSSTNLCSAPSPVSVPTINVVAPGGSWGGSVIPNHLPKDTLNEGRVSSPSKNETVYSGISCTKNVMRHDVNSVSELQMCSDILSTGNSDSYFSGPIAYTCNVTEGKGLKEPNNNGGFTYAAVAAKVKPLDL